MSQSQKEAAEFAEVLMAYSRGEPVQMRSTTDGVKWSDLTYPLWDFCRYEYRVAPKPVEAWGWKFKNGMHGHQLFTTKDKAEASYSEGRPILMREVTE